ncbi:MAG: lipoprotein insertase outer membrane protein LolB [Gammaproteobacteria bacterium]
MRSALSVVFNLKHYPGLLIMVLYLSGCAMQPSLTDRQIEQRLDLHIQKLETLREWKLIGRMSVRMEQEGWSAGLHWQQGMDDFNLRVIAPFGRGTVEISGNNDKVSLRTAENEIFEDDDVDLLLRHKLGWDIPVSALAYWVKGQPEPHKPQDALTSDTRGRVSELQQAGWLISYERYTNSQGYDLPSLITLQREGIRLRLNISRWDIST